MMNCFPHVPAPKGTRALFFLQAALIIATGLVIYGPALNGGWLWDDPQYVTANPLLNDPARLVKAWFVPGSTMEYYPLQDTVIALQWWRWGPHPLGYHLTNVALHVVSGLLLWRLFAQFGLRLAWLGGLLFVVHPLNVESVAWISELKNTLSLPPFLIAILALVRYVERPRRADYLLALGFFTVALLAKISMAPFPFVILLYVWWKRGRVVKTDLLMASPFLIVALALSALTVWAYTRYGQLHPDHPFVPPVGGLGARIALAGLTLSVYFARFFWPWRPMPMSPQWSLEPLSLSEFLPWLVGMALLGWFWTKGKTWGRHALLGVGFFLLMIAPFSGLATQSYMYFTWVMDHFMYIPMIGLIGLTIAAMEKVAAKLSRSAHAVAVSVLSLVMMMLVWQSRAYASAWVDAGHLWSYAVKINPGAWLAHYNLGNNYRARGRFEDAIDEYQTSIQLHPAFDWSHNNLGISLLHFPDRLPEAAAEFREAVRIRPQFPEAHTNLGNVLAETGNVDEAIAEYQAALASEPGFAEARYDLALALANAGRTAEAALQLHELLRRKPGFHPAQDLLKRMGEP